MKAENRGVRNWGLKPLILAWIVPILIANFFFVVLLNYLMARDNDSKRIADHIRQRRMDLVFLTNLPDLRGCLMDLKLALNEEAEFVKEDLQSYLSNYLKNLDPPFPHVLSVVSLEGAEIIRIRNGEITPANRNLVGSPHMKMLLAGKSEQASPPPPEFPESSLSDNSRIVDVLPVYDEINNKPIGGIIYEYHVPVALLTKHARDVLMVNLGLGVSVAVCALMVIYIALANIIRPLNRLTVASQEMLTGDLSKEIEVQGWGETRLLATTFEAMRQRLKSQFEQLEDNARRLMGIIDFLPDATLIIDKHRKVLFWNKAIEEMTGYSRDRILGKYDSECAIPFYGERGSILVGIAIEGALRGDTCEDTAKKYMELKNVGNILTGSAWCPTLKGEKRLLSATASVLYDEEGEIWGAIESIRDVTSHHRTLQEKEHLQTQLFQSQKMEAVGRLAGGVAHDFNNLLTAIMGYAGITKMKLAGDDPLRRNVDEILNAANRAATLTGQLLAFSRKQILQPQVVDLNNIVASIEKMLRRLIGEDIELLTALGSLLGAVKVDPGQIEQVIMNLAVNARDAMPHGGKLTIETDNVFLDESYAREHSEVIPGGYVMLGVSDNGVGMDPKTILHIFEPFFTTKGHERGTGLGLSMVHGIVKQSGGHISVYSEPGKGACFKIYFPMVDDDVQAFTASAATEETPRGYETILVVEDNDSLRKLAARILSDHGYRVVEAPHGFDALLASEQHEGPIHLMLTDVVMPHMSGNVLAARLATSRPEMKVLYMSGYTDNTIVHHGILDAGLAYLQKPFKLDVLLRKVREVLDT